MVSKAVLAATTAFALGATANAQAYMDPGTGAMLWQTILAALVGVSFYTRRIVSWVKRQKTD